MHCNSTPIQKLNPESGSVLFVVGVGVIALLFTFITTQFLLSQLAILQNQSLATMMSQAGFYNYEINDEQSYSLGGPKHLAAINSASWVFDMWTENFSAPVADSTNLVAGNFSANILFDEGPTPDALKVKVTSKVNHLAGFMGVLAPVDIGAEASVQQNQITLHVFRDVSLSTNTNSAQGIKLALEASGENFDSPSIYARLLLPGAYQALDGNMFKQYWADLFNLYKVSMCTAATPEKCDPSCKGAASEATCVANSVAAAQACTDFIGSSYCSAPYKSDLTQWMDSHLLSGKAACSSVGPPWSAATSTIPVLPLECKQFSLFQKILNQGYEGTSTLPGFNSHQSSLVSSYNDGVLAFKKIVNALLFFAGAAEHHLWTFGSGPYGVLQDKIDKESYVGGLTYIGKRNSPIESTDFMSQSDKYGYSYDTGISGKSLDSVWLFHNRVGGGWESSSPFGTSNLQDEADTAAGALGGTAPNLASLSVSLANVLFPPQEALFADSGRLISENVPAAFGKSYFDPDDQLTHKGWPTNPFVDTAPVNFDSDTSNNLIWAQYAIGTTSNGTATFRVFDQIAKECSIARANQTANLAAGLPPPPEPMFVVVTDGWPSIQAVGPVGAPIIVGKADGTGFADASQYYDKVSLSLDSHLSMITSSGSKYALGNTCPIFVLYATLESESDEQKKFIASLKTMSNVFVLFVKLQDVVTSGDYTKLYSQVEDSIKALILTMKSASVPRISG